MEGVTDHLMRSLLCKTAAIDRCVTEFLRVTNAVFPRRVFIRAMPELLAGGVTSRNVPVYLQLLGNNPEMMAANAAKAAQLGCPGIDLNFGCPAKTVNKHKGGAILLEDPETVHRIARAVRQAVPAGTPVTAKMRLGYMDKSRHLDNAIALAEAGVDELCVHARTKLEGYKPPAHWHYIAAIREQLDIPVIANGEIWTSQDAADCQKLSGCHRLMLGRGLLADPDLGHKLHQQSITPNNPMPWIQVLELLIEFQLARADNYPARHAGDKLKQWLIYLRRHYLQARELFDLVKRLHAADDILALLRQHLNRARLANQNQVQ
jgi:tRNA-dihydrouridine synthase C